MLRQPGEMRFLTRSAVQPANEMGPMKIAFALSAAAIITRDEYSENSIHQVNMYTVEQEGGIGDRAKVIVVAVGHCRGPRLVSAAPRTQPPSPFLTLHSIVDQLLPHV